MGLPQHTTPEYLPNFYLPPLNKDFFFNQKRCLYASDP